MISPLLGEVTKLNPLQSQELDLCFSFSLLLPLLSPHLQAHTLTPPHTLLHTSC